MMTIYDVTMTTVAASEEEPQHQKQQQKSEVFPFVGSVSICRKCFHSSMCQDMSQRHGDAVGSSKKADRTIDLSYAKNNAAADAGTIWLMTPSLCL